MLNVAGSNESISSEKMEMNKGSSHSREKPTMGRSSSSSEVKKPAEKDLSSSKFVNKGKRASMEFDWDKPHLFFSFLELVFLLCFIIPAVTDDHMELESFRIINAKKEKKIK